MHRRGGGTLSFLDGSRRLPTAFSKDLYGCHDLQSSSASDSPEIEWPLQVIDYDQNIAGVKGSYDDHSRDLRHYQGENCSMLGQVKYRTPRAWMSLISPECGLC